MHALSAESNVNNHQTCLLTCRPHLRTSTSKAPSSTARASAYSHIAGQTALAYVTAKTHGLEAEAENLAEALGGNLPPLDPHAQLLAPPAPILKEDNWPLLTVSKGYFENLAKGTGAGAGHWGTRV